MPPKSRKKKTEVESKIEHKDTILESKSNDVPIVKTEKELNSEKDIARRIYVNPEDRITSNALDPKELARVLAITAELYTKNQISFTKLTNERNAEEVAIRMLLDRKCPLYLIRVMSENSTEIICEKWDVNLMTFPNVPILQVGKK